MGDINKEDKKTANKTTKVRKATNKNITNEDTANKNLTDVNTANMIVSVINTPDAPAIVDTATKTIIAIIIHIL